MLLHSKGVVLLDAEMLVQGGALQDVERMHLRVLCKRVDFDQSNS